MPSCKEKLDPYEQPVIPLFHRLLPHIHGKNKSSYQILFARNPEDGRFYAIKIFPDTFQGRLEFERERMRHKFFSHSQYLVKAIECVSKEEAHPIPSDLLGYLPSIFQSENFNYIIMPKLANDTLLAILMRTIHNNSQGVWCNISLRL
jgi:hypothetical protein